MRIRPGTERTAINIEGVVRSSQDDCAESWRKLQSSDLPTRFASSHDEDEQRQSTPERFLRWLAGALTLAAVLASAVLLISDATPQLAALLRMLIAEALRAWELFSHAPLSALPLLLAGASYTALQGFLRPPPMELLRRLMLGAAFLLWGVVQLMPPSALAANLGDLVIALYVFDLGLMVQAELQ